MDILKKYSEEKEKSDTGVKFEEGYRVVLLSRNPKIIQWVMKYSGGLAKDEKQASFVLIGFAAVAVIITLVLIFSGGEDGAKPFQ